MDDYRRSLTPYPFVEGQNSEFRYKSSKWLVRGLDIIFWGMSGLFLMLAIAIFSSNPLWAISLLITTALVCPLVPIHFVAKLGLASFSVFPPVVALPMTGVLVVVWGLSVLRGPSSSGSE